MPCFHWYDALTTSFISKTKGVFLFLFFCLDKNKIEKRKKKIVVNIPQVFSVLDSVSGNKLTFFFLTFYVSGRCSLM